ncbi:MAG: tetratricopeptide repeat protein [Chlamydiae bacterium]|nr:tetratricopeptide repeat protein [Chlamydiota bacterium]
MAEINWLDVLGWKGEELEDLRFVGYSYLKQGLYDTAITFFEALVTLVPDSAYDVQTLGALYLQKGNNLMALNYIEKALKIDPNHAPTLLNKTKALLSLGYKKQGLSQAKNLETSEDRTVANQAAALFQAYS